MSLFISNEPVIELIYLISLASNWPQTKLIVQRMCSSSPGGGSHACQEEHDTATTFSSICWVLIFESYRRWVRRNIWYWWKCISKTPENYELSLQLGHEWIWLKVLWKIPLNIHHGSMDEYRTTPDFEFRNIKTQQNELKFNLEDVTIERWPHLKNQMNTKIASLPSNPDNLKEEWNEPANQNHASVFENSSIEKEKEIRVIRRCPCLLCHRDRGRGRLAHCLHGLQSIEDTERRKTACVTGLVSRSAIVLLARTANGSPWNSVNSGISLDGSLIRSHHSL